MKSIRGQQEGKEEGEKEERKDKITMGDHSAAKTPTSLTPRLRLRLLLAPLPLLALPLALRRRRVLLMPHAELDELHPKRLAEAVLRAFEDEVEHARRLGNHWASVGWLHGDETSVTDQA